jgi:hypothetical protein
MSIRRPDVVEKIYPARVANEMNGGKSLGVVLPKELKEDPEFPYSPETRFTPKLRIDNKTGEIELVLVPQADE